MPNEKGTRTKLSAVSSLIFSDLSELRNHMLENTRKSVERLISNAVEIKDIKFGGNYIDNGSSDVKSEEVIEVFKDKNKNTIDEINKEKLMQNDVKDVIMNGNIDSNNIKQQET